MVATIYAARSHRDFPRLQRQYGELTDDDLHASASNARAAHLPHLRLLVRQKNDPEILPIFAEDHSAACPRCHPAHSPQSLHQERIEQLTQQDVTVKSLLRKSAAQLNDMPCPEFWSALVDCVLPAHRPFAKSYGLRPKSTSKPSNDPVNTSSQTDSSSPPAARSSSPFSVDYNELDEDAFATLRCVPESLTNHLAYTFDRAALSCLHQTHPKTEFRPRLHSLRYTAHVGPATITSWDDGGLATFNKLPDAWQVGDPSVTLRESKIASSNVAYNEITREICPVLTNENAAQFLLEVVTAMRANPGRLRYRYSPACLWPHLPAHACTLTCPSALF